MKYLVLLALLGLVCASPVPKAQPESEVFSDSYETNEDCYEDETDSFQPADVTDDIRIDTYEGGDAECDDEPIDEERLEDIIIDDREFQEENEHEEDQARVEEDVVIRVGEEDPYTDEECEDEIVTEEPPRITVEVRVDTPDSGNNGGPDNSECYDENGDPIEPGSDFDNSYDPLNDNNDIENVDIFKIGDSDKAYDLEDLYIDNSSDVEVDGRVDSFEDCIEEY